MAKKGKIARPAARKPKNPKEARAGLITVAEHVRETFKTYRAHKPSMPIAGDDLEAYVAARARRAQWWADMRHLWGFIRAVEAYLSEGNKKRIGQHLGLERGRGNPGGRKPGKSFDLGRKISEQRETKSETRKTKQGKPARTRWKEVGLDHGMSDQAARKRAKRASLVRAEDDAKEFAARLKQHLEQKPPRAGKAKARSAAMGKKIRARNRRKR